MTGSLSVVVVHHRTPGILAESLARLSRGAPGVPTIVVDTAADPAFLVGLQELHPGLVVVSAPNHSYAHALNLGLQHASTPFVALMNADVYVEPETFPRLLAAARADPRAAVVGPLARTPDGRRQDLGPLYRLHYLRLAAMPGGNVQVPWLSGCLHLVRREAIETVGGYDDSLRFYNEDLELCLRVRAAGWRCRLVDAPVVHLGGRSTPDDPAFLLEGLRGGYQVVHHYLPAALRPFHRAALQLWGGAAAHLARTPEQRAVYARLAAMARSGDAGASPFGATLEDRTPLESSRP